MLTIVLNPGLTIRLGLHGMPKFLEMAQFKKRDGMPEMAINIESDLRQHFRVFYDDSGAVGRRYRRQDEAGTPFCVTIDSQSLQDQTVTVRERDSMKQDRIAASNLRSWN